MVYPIDRVLSLFQSFFKASSGDARSFCANDLVNVFFLSFSNLAAPTEALMTTILYCLLSLCSANETLNIWHPVVCFIYHTWKRWSAVKVNKYVDAHKTIDLRNLRKMLRLTDCQEVCAPIRHTLISNLKIPNIMFVWLSSHKGQAKQ